MFLVICLVYWIRWGNWTYDRISDMRTYVLVKKAPLLVGLQVEESLGSVWWFFNFSKDGHRKCCKGIDQSDGLKFHAGFLNGICSVCAGWGPHAYFQMLGETRNGIRSPSTGINQLSVQATELESVHVESHHGLETSVVYTRDTRPILDGLNNGRRNWV